MKVALLILACLAVASCAVYPFNVSTGCNVASCARNSWNANSTTYSYVCPKTGNRQAAFRQNDYTNELYLDFTAYNSFTSDQKVSMPLTYNPSYTSSGLQYFYSLTNGAQFSILNCTIPYSRQVSPLCSSHQLVGGKYINGTFQSVCAFGLDYSYSGFLSEESPINF